MMRSKWGVWGLGRAGGSGELAPPTPPSPNAPRWAKLRLMRLLSYRPLVLCLGTGLASAVIAGCGGRVQGKKDSNPESTDRCITHPALCAEDDQGGPHPDDEIEQPDPDEPGEQAMGGRGSMDEMGMAGALNIDTPEPMKPNFFRLHTAGMLVYTGDSGPLTYYSAVPLPENTLVEARLDDIEMRTGVSGSVTFLIEDCEAKQDETELCQLTVTSFGGGPSGAPDIDAPLDLRLGGFSSQTNYVATAVRKGTSWSASLRPTGMLLGVSRWQGALIEERYEGGELDFIRVEEETSHKYALPITQIEASCSLDACSFTLFAGAE